MARIKPGRVYGGDYEVVRELARGGMGAVFVARQHSTGRERALKVMLPQLVDNEKARERFLREARIGASIPSTHVVEVLASGIDEQDETPWLVMELLQGETLASRLERVGRLSPSDTLSVLTQAGHALREAHARGIFHLDLKPENLFFTRTHSSRGEEETLKVLDFGIARIAAESRHSVTVTSGVGSALWMAPEQVAKGFKVSPASDVWALGLIAFRVLTGKYYWENANVDPGEEISQPAVLVELTAMPLSSASVRARSLGVQDALPAGFDDWFARCVVRDAARRFADAGAAVDALCVVLAERPAPATGPSARPAPPPTEPLRGVPVAPPLGAMPPRTEPMPPFVHSPPRPIGGAPPAPVPSVPPAPTPSRGIFVAIGAGLLGVGSVIGLVMGGGRGGDPAHDAGGAPVVSVADVPSSPPMPVPTPPMPVPASPAPEPRCPDGMVKIPAGRFMMGSPAGVGENDEHPQHAVEVPRAFCMDRTEVTVAAYRTCSSCEAASSSVSWPGVTSSDHRVWDAACNARFSDRDNHPVNCLNWTQARGYCMSRGARLPTEAEWEYAARGGQNGRYTWGDEAPDATRLNACGTECRAWKRGRTRSTGVTITDVGRVMYEADDGWPTTAPVGSFPANRFGLADMAGNVWEWVEDTYNPTAYGSRTEGFNARGVVTITSSGFTEHRVIRGGGWGRDVPSWVRASLRNWNTRSVRGNDVGFRCARDI